MCTIISLVSCRSAALFRSPSFDLERFFSIKALTRAGCAAGLAMPEEMTCIMNLWSLQRVTLGTDTSLLNAVTRRPPDRNEKRIPRAADKS
eukprot:CAMPEP_0202396400 /NCGR_PEP_ID=MMETSP1127-20130417/94489_1 /ASSEMBLY_ACC=CAM_ASM_000462 /TAXON_ID=3047 /ORGANISM="Dunaliella tertiolecta, Strain CCMP1320" /LENGTH=90 /DNA_ID=CAMNT_0048999175 /DNA_START=317 /DNA_END=589 /DNA_ORIENTATION=+